MLQLFETPIKRKAIAAYLVDPAVFPNKQFLGYENHLNVFHCRKKGAVLA
jgi:hypothetical protein